MTIIDRYNKQEIEGPNEIRQAQFSDTHEYIIDSEGQKVDFDDPRIVFVSPEARNPYGKRLVIDLYKKYNRNIRIADETDKNTLQYAKKICSGRECLPCTAITGEILKDIHENRDESEITLYRTPIDQHGPCQNGAWPVVWKTFAKRLNVKNAIFYAFPKYSNNYLGLNADLLVWENISYAIGHYITEARNALQCVAEDKDLAIKIFEEITDECIDNIKLGKKTLRTGLLGWAKKITKIPRKAKVEEIPKILIFGGLNLMFDHYPLEQFFLEKGIIAKVVDIVESMNILLAESIIRFGFKKGLMSPKEQFDETLLDASDFSENDIKEAERANRSRNAMNFLNSQCEMFRRIMSKSGLLFDSDANFVDLLEKGHRYVSCNSFTETPLITGRFLHSVEEGIYDGLINLGTFNCQPAMNSQAIIRPLANKYEIPYAAIDCEGPWISTTQRRLLETVAVQAIRVRRRKNEEAKNLNRN